MVFHWGSLVASGGNACGLLFHFISSLMLFLGLIGIYTRCRLYIQLYLFYLYPATVVGLWHLRQIYLAITGGAVWATLSLIFPRLAVVFAFFRGFFEEFSSFTDFLVASVLTIYGLLSIWALFEWEDAAEAACIVVDCTCQENWFRKVLRLIGAALHFNAEDLPAESLSQFVQYLFELLALAFQGHYAKHAVYENQFKSRARSILGVPSTDGDDEENLAGEKGRKRADKYDNGYPRKP